MSKTYTSATYIDITRTTVSSYVRYLSRGINIKRAEWDMRFVERDEDNRLSGIKYSTIRAGVTLWRCAYRRYDGKYDVRIYEATERGGKTFTRDLCEMDKLNLRDAVRVLYSKH